MRDNKFATGPYTFKEINKEYLNNTYLEPGIYNIIILHTPLDLYPPFITIKTDEMKLETPILINYKFRTDNYTIQYAVSLGYKIYILNGYVSLNEDYIYTDYIQYFYKLWLVYKDLMKVLDNKELKDQVISKHISEIDIQELKYKITSFV